MFFLHIPSMLTLFFRILCITLFPAGIFFPSAAFSQTTLTIVTDPSWEVSSRKTYFGEYPLSAEQITLALRSSMQKAVPAETNERSKIVPGAMPIWRNHTADGEGEAYQFRKTVAIGAQRIKKATLEINSDDVARVYINQRLASVDKRDGKLKDGYDKWFLFRSVSGFMYDRIYTYDVTDYFFSNVTNTIVVEAVSLAFDGSHAYISAKIVLELENVPPPAPKPLAKNRPSGKQKNSISTTTRNNPAPTPAKPQSTVFEAGHDPDIEQLSIGSILELGHVSFKANDYKLDTASYHTLLALAAFLKKHPGLKIEVGGHTNLRPADSFAATLSTNRARAVAQFLKDNGVAAQQVVHKGYGKTRPRIAQVGKEADKANQRVEVKVLAK